MAGVRYELPDGRVLLDDVSFRVGEGAKVALVGANGAGKTTLLRIITGDLDPHAGVAWSRVVAVGPHARAVEVDDRVLFDPEDKSEVEVQGEIYVLMRERDIHAVAADRLDDGGESTGLYL